jgi:hypothetical protein
MRKLWIFICVLCCTVLLVIICIAARPRSRVLLALFQPHDLYSVISLGNMSLSNKDARYSFRINHKYVGTYSIDLHGKFNFDDSILSTAKIKTVIVSRNIVLKNVVTKLKNSGGPNYLSIVDYDVSTEVLQRQDVDILCSIVETDSNFQKMHGPLSFEIRRLPDFDM